MNIVLKKACAVICTTSLIFTASCGNGAASGNAAEENDVSGNVVNTAVSETENAQEDNTQSEAEPVSETQEVPEEADGLKALVKPETEFQTMIGFGAGFTWYSDWMLKIPQNKTEMADLLFADAKLTVLRFKNEYKYFSDEIKNDCRETQIYNLAQERADKYGEKVTVLMSCWSAPKELKSNDKTAGSGTIKKDDDGNYMYDEYGEWWAESVEAYMNAGVPIDYVSIQNECDFVAEWDGMELAPIETEKEAEYSKAFFSAYNAIHNKLGDSSPKMIAPETMSFNTFSLKSYMKPIFDVDPNAVSGIGHHLYVGGNSAESPEGSTNEPDSFNKNFRDNADAFGDKYSIWQTEFFRGTPLQTAMLINNSLVNGNLNSYIFWTGVWANDKPGNDIVSVTYNGDYSYGSMYWVMRHFSEFIRPGYKRVQVDYPYKGGFRVSAFKNPDESKMAVLFINPTDEDIDVNVPVNGFTVKDSAVYQTVLLEDAYDAGEYYNNLGKLTATLTLKAKSITTIDLTTEKAK